MGVLAGRTWVMAAVRAVMVSITTPVTSFTQEVGVAVQVGIAELVEDLIRMEYIPCRQGVLEVLEAPAKVLLRLVVLVAAGEVV